jgi:hypothetical protein
VIADAHSVYDMFRMNVSTITLSMVKFMLTGHLMAIDAQEQEPIVLLDELEQPF